MTVDEAGQLLTDCIQCGGAVFACGNGGSMAAAQHFVAELTGAFRERKRCALRAAALGTNLCELTAIANDYGFEQVFARPLDAWADEGDVLIALSTSGKSKNVIQAALVAKSLGCEVIAMTSNSGQFQELGDIAGERNVLAAPSDDTPEVQEWHEAVLHALAGHVEARAFVEADALVADLPIVGTA